MKLLVKHGNRLPGDLESPSLAVLKTRLDIYLLCMGHPVSEEGAKLHGKSFVSCFTAAHAEAGILCRPEYPKQTEQIAGCEACSLRVTSVCAALPAAYQM